MVSYVLKANISVNNGSSFTSMCTQNPFILSIYWDRFASDIFAM